MLEVEARSETEGSVLPGSRGQGIPGSKGLSEVFPGGKFRTQDNRKLGLKPSCSTQSVTPVRQEIREFRANPSRSSG